MNITQEELKKELHYNPETGIFTRLVANCNSVKVEEVAGSINEKGYRRISVLGKKYREHRLAFLYMTGLLPRQTVDHINHIKDDNRWINLRDVSQRDNCANRSLSVNNTTGIIGVSPVKRDNRWSAEIRYRNQIIRLGSSKDFFEVCCARKSAENKYNFHPNHGSAI